jgi:hypothetical protein
MNSAKKNVSYSLLSATSIGKHFNISSQRLNLILSEIGWIEKEVWGWALTKQGKKIGGKELEHESSGNSYVMWPETILNNSHLINAITNSCEPTKTEFVVFDSSKTENFREKFPASFRTKDGHLVRSRAEVLRDNALYDYKLVHAYERKLPIEENVYCDFFIPIGNLYLEYWGLENDVRYTERKKRKLDLYRKNDFKLIELTDQDIKYLDDVLPKKLLKFGIKVY